MRGTWQTTDSGGGGVRIVLLVLAVLLFAGPVTAAVGSVARAVAEVLTIAVYAVASAAGLAALAGLALVAVRVRHRILYGPRAVTPRRVMATVLDGRRAADLPEPSPRALSAARDDVPALPRIHAGAHVVTSRPARARCPRCDRRRS
jgi:hypothetical protein